jgi:four helix bundle protein
VKNSILKDKSFAFALRIIKLYQYLGSEHREYILSKQILRAGTSIGANIEESVHAQSRTDFIHKLSIAQKEACESNYWLRLLTESGFIKPKLAASLLYDCEEIQKLLTASIKTAKLNMKKEKEKVIA